MRRIVLVVALAALLLTGRTAALSQDHAQAPARTKVRELRLGVVCYGGISLAIYMYGTTRELHHLLLASDALELDAQADPPVHAGEIGFHGNQLPPSARHYYQLLSDKWERDDVRTRVVVDIISGTSAGGINGIILAKAIATNRPIEELRSLWFDEADIVRLAGGRPWTLKVVWRLLHKRPALTGDRWLRQIYEAFEKMDGDKTLSPSKSLLPASLERDRARLDLLVTSTDYYGSSRVVEVGDPPTSTDTYHNQVFHFEYPTRSDEKPSFEGKAANAILAFAARSSASFPVAFPPMSIGNLLQVIPEGGNDGAVLARQVFRHQLFDAGSCAKANEPFEDCASAFAKGLFLVDGGVLDNYPLGIAFQRAGRTTPSVPSQRVFLYLEPSPSDPPAGSAAANRIAPNSWQIILGSSATIPGNEPIAEDFRQLARHNERVDRIRDLLARDEEKAVRERDPAAKPVEPAPDLLQAVAALPNVPPEPRDATVATQVEKVVDYKLDTLDKEMPSELRSKIAPTPQDIREQRKEISIQRRKIEAAAAAGQPALEEAYVRLRVHSVLDQMARDLAFRVCDLPEDYVGPSASLARAIVFQWAAANGLSKAVAGSLPPPALDRESIDRQRRRDFLTAFDLGYLRRNLRFVLAWIDGQYPGEVPMYSDELRADSAGGMPTYSYELSTDQLEAAHSAVTRAIDEVSALVRGDKLARLVGTEAVERLHGALCVNPERGKRIEAQAAEMITAHQGAIDDFLKQLAPKLLEEQDRIRGELFDQFNRQTDAWGKPDARRAVLARYLGFPYWDRVAYPYTAFSGTGELVHADVWRLSPRDAESLCNNGAERLAGNRLFHFGAFLKRQDREGDYVWGRLDGAERLSKLLGGNALSSGMFTTILGEEEEGTDAIGPKVLAPVRGYVEAAAERLKQDKDSNTATAQCPPPSKGRRES